MGGLVRGGAPGSKIARLPEKLRVINIDPVFDSGDSAAARNWR
jgi:hypothetical protein